jgi:MFS family permease
LFRALRIRPFRFVFGTLALSMVGDAALLVVVGIALVDLTGSYTAAGLGYVGIALPALFAPIGGIFVDRVRRRPFLIWLFTLTALLVLALLYVRDRSDVWIIYLVSLGTGLSHYLKDAALLGLLKAMLPEDLLVSANSLLQTMFQGMRLVGPVVGGGLYALGGLTLVAGFNAATFVPVVVALSVLRIDEPRTVPGTAAAGWLRSAADGAVHLWRDLPLRRMTGTVAGAMLLMGLPVTTVYAVVTQGLSRPAPFVAVLASAQGVGAVLGGFVCSVVVSRLGETRTVCAGLVLYAAGELGLVVSNTGFVVGCLVLAYAGLTWIWVASAALLQKRTPLATMGRVGTAFDMLTSTPQAVSIAGGALLIALLDFRTIQVVLAVGICCLATTLFLAPTARPALSGPRCVAEPGLDD